MKRNLALAILLGLLCLALPVSAEPMTWHVDDDVEMDPDFTTIQAAVDAASSNDTIVILPGNYSTFVVNKPDLTIRSEEGPDSVIVDGGGGEGIHNNGNAAGLVLDGLTIMNPGGAGIRLGEYGPAPDSVIRNCVIRDISGELVLKEANITFENNVLYNPGGGTYAINVQSDDIIFQNNRIENSSASYGALAVWEVKNGIFRNISIANCTGPAALVYVAENCTFTQNSFIDNPEGIWLYQPGDDHIFDCNNFINTPFVKAWGWNDAFTATLNATALVTYTYGGVEHTGYPGNFWSDYAGVDANGDGIIDEPYVLPDGLGTDYAPLMGAWEDGVIVTPEPAVISIVTEDQLRLIGLDDAYPLDGSYVLENDIALTGDWTPIGTFTGTFDGNGHAINGLSITKTSDYTGLFTRLFGATVTNLTLSEVSISGGKYTGAVAGDIRDGSLIDSCHVIGTVYGSEMWVGGIIGGSYGTGEIGNIISNCSVIGDVTGAKNNVGGICGRADSGATAQQKEVIRDCYFVGTVSTTSTTSTSLVGGIVGNSPTVGISLSNCYAVGTVEGYRRTGGIIGSATAATSVVDCVALLSSVTSNYASAPNEAVAPIAGYYAAGATFSGNYAWDGMTNGSTLYTAVPPYSGSEYGDYITASEDVWNTYSSTSNTGVWATFSTEIWKPNAGNSDYQLPVLAGQETPVVGDASYLNPDSGSGQTPPSLAYLTLFSPTEGTIWLVDEPVQLNATVTVGDDLVYTWDLGNGESVTGENTSYVYTAAGTYTVTLTVANDAGSINKETTIVVYDPDNPDPTLPYTVLYHDTVDIVNGSTIMAAISPRSGGYTPGEDFIEIPANSVGGMLNASDFIFDLWKSQKPIPTYSLTDITTPDGAYYPNVQNATADLAWRSFDGMTSAAKKYDPNVPLANGTTIYTVYGDYSVVNSDPSGAQYVIVMTLNVVESEPGPKTWYVDDDGDADFATIQAAVDAATSGDTIVVKDGAYTENVGVTKGLVLMTENGPENVVVTAASPAAPVFAILADGVTVRGFTLRGPTNEHVAGIENIGYDDCLFVGNDCGGALYNGIHLGGNATNCTITENYCHDNTRRGISLRDDVYGNYVYNNLCTDNGDTQICIKDNANSNFVWANTFVGAVECLSPNTFNSTEPVAYTYEGADYTGFAGNYWSDYTGVDADGNGIGDAPYILPGGTDYAPLMGAWENGVIVEPKPEPIVFNTSVTVYADEPIVVDNVTYGGNTFFNILAAAGYTYTYAESDAGFSDRKPLLTLTIDGVTYPTEDFGPDYAWKFYETIGTGDDYKYKKALNGYIDKSGTYYIWYGDMSQFDWWELPSVENSTYVVELNVTLLPTRPGEGGAPSGVTIISPLSNSSYAVGASVHLAATATGDDLTYTWDLGNGDTVTGQDTSYAYPVAGNYTITLTVANDAGSAEASTGIIILDSDFPYIVLYQDTVDIVNGSTIMAAISPKSGGYTPGEDYIEIPANSVGGMLNASGFIFDLWKSQKPIPTYSLTDITTPDGAYYPNVQNETADLAWRSFDGMTSAATKYDPNVALENGTTIYTVYGDYDVVSSDPSGAQYVIITTLNIVEPGTANPPVADFDANTTSGDAPLAVAFTDRSTNTPTSWSWTFGDGATSAEQNPVHTYTTPGTYTVTLTVANAAGSDSATKTITVTEPGEEADTLVLHPGWNFVSTPKRLADGENTFAIFDGVDTAAHSILLYDGLDYDWKQMGLTDTFRPLDAVWIYANGTYSIPLAFAPGGAEVPPTKDLGKGWNAIGFSDTVPESAAATLLSLGDSWATLIGYDAQNQRYESAIIRTSASETQEMQPMQGYWIYTTRAETLAAISG